MSQSGVLDTLKEKLSPHALMQTVSDNKGLLLLVGLYLIAGFVTAFILKKCNKFIFFIALVVGALLFLHYQGFMTIVIDWSKVQTFLGIKPIELPNENMLPVYWEWIKSNILLVISFSVGFVFGLKLS